MKKYRFIWLTTSLLMALAFSALWTAPAYADDSLPPPPAEEQSVIVEETPPTEEQTPDAPPATEETTPETENVLLQIPEGTEIIVTDENGEILPLASQEAQEMIAIIDPIWCPAGIAPKALTSGCSASFTKLSDLVESFVPTGSGVIWIQAGEDTGVDVVIDGTGNWAAATNFNLTLQGGWNGTNLSTIVNGVSEFDTAINIINWNGAITISDIAFVGADNPFDSTKGVLNVETSKNILVKNVTISDSDVLTNGAYLDNTTSTVQSTVTVKNSVFNGNPNSGLVIYSKGAVTLTNITANDNFGANGVLVNNDQDNLTSPVTISYGDFNRNLAGSGLDVISNGAVKLTQILATDNTGDGVHVDNKYDFNNTVTISNLSAFDNGGNGLKVETRGSITGANLTTNDNSEYGTHLNNSTSTSQVGVSLTGYNFFNDNGLSGLQIDTRGAVTTYNLTALKNGSVTPGAYGGVFIDNTDIPSLPQNVILYGYNYFSDNYGYGLEINTYGAVTTNNLTAVMNAQNGVDITNTTTATAKAVTLNGTNVFNSNGISGLSVVSKGAITLKNVTAYRNQTGYGVILNNRNGAQSLVNIVGYGLFEYNELDGLNILSNGVITAANLSASYNNDSGAVIDTIGISGPQTVTLTGINKFHFNYGGDGLRVASDGTINVSNLYAGNNLGQGAELDNFTNWDARLTNFTSFGSVKVTNGSFYKNLTNGLRVNTRGTVTLTNLNSSYNGADGFYIEAKGNITLSCIFANKNTNGFMMYGPNIPLLTIYGLYTSGNSGINEDLNFTSLTRRSCP